MAKIAEPTMLGAMKLVALLNGPDRPGLVAKFSGWIYEHGGNIIHADQHRDDEEGIFFQRIEWEPTADHPTAREDFAEFATAETQMAVTVRPVGASMPVALLVSKQDHCFHDLVLRWRSGEYPATIPFIVSNHEVLREAAEGYGIPFHHIPVTPATKQEAETRLLELARAHGVELMVMARYMQILSDDFFEQTDIPVINVHHSFLPAFAGAKPYHQAHRRGVKLIGATAHYATAELDAGPIIAQEVSRITHRHGVADLVRRGQDLEKLVISQAVRWHLENRILIYRNKTVIFD
ncbi:MAG: formyltetrahydrofolate deformylase [Verrucomicrobiota bacterium]